MGLRVVGESFGQFLERYACHEDPPPEMEARVEEVMMRMPPYSDDRVVGREDKPRFLKEQSAKGTLTLHYDLLVSRNDGESEDKKRIPFDLMMSLADEKGSWMLQGNSTPPHFAGIASEDPDLEYVHVPVLKKIVIGVMVTLCTEIIEEEVYVTPEEGI